ncbi:MAG: sigma 54-interacting transcriptional regulator [Peptococcaceae bacterium]|nr:sigma 54-interacting transcriptional regulator [Peptococcaceae bacterium]
MSERERIRALEQEVSLLKTSNQWFTEILDAIMEGIEVVDKDGTVTYANRSFSRILEESAEERLGKNIFDVSPNGALVEALRTGQPSIAKLHTTLTRKKVVLSNATPIIDAAGRLMGAISVFMDISDAERTSRLLEKRNHEINRLKERVQQLASSDYTFDDILGQSRALNQCKKVAAKIAGTKMTVLLSGESGTGKELFAHSIHAASRRARGPFVKINCAAIPDSLLESEFFGYEAGAFSGAGKAKMGKFELANGGTLFLDEIGEMNYNLQAKLLRVLQDNEVERLGSIRPIKIEVRVIAATNKDLPAEIARGTFRKDLYYRLNEFNITLPSLDQRKEDIPVIAQHYIEKYNEEYSTDFRLTDQICRLLMEKSWPGNVRELQNYLGKLVLFWDEDGEGETTVKKDLFPSAADAFGFPSAGSTLLDAIHTPPAAAGLAASVGPELPADPLIPTAKPEAAAPGPAVPPAGDWEAPLPAEVTVPVFRLPGIAESLPDNSSIEELERKMILAALEKHGYDTKGKQRAAKELKISLSTLYNKLRLYKKLGELQQSKAGLGGNP